MDKAAYKRKMIIIIAVIGVLFFGGATAYHKIEGWRYIDALYFSAYTMTTVGYGEFHPVTDLGKIFTIFYLFASVSIGVYGLTMIATYFIETREQIWVEKLNDISIRPKAGRILGKVKDLFVFDVDKLTGNGKPCKEDEDDDSKGLEHAPKQKV